MRLPDLLFALLALGASVLLWWLTAVTTPPLEPGADLAVYQLASVSLHEAGTPYDATALEEAQYRYPPLLALLMPILDPFWYALMLLGVAIPFWLGWRQDGLRGTLWPLAVIGPTLHGLVVGNIQPLANGLWAAAPFYRTAGPVLLAVVSWVKVWPAISIMWYLGRRDWRSLGIYAAAMAVLTVPQLPWLDDWLAYWMSEGAAFTAQGLALPVIVGDVGWLLVATIAIGAALLLADRPWGWRLTILAYFAANPRWFLPSLSSLSAMVYRARRNAP
jgi:hypothetical protein